MSKDDLMTVIAWGQYVHWCDLQFNHSLEISQDTSKSNSVICAMVHWLAAEYVVLEGWQQLGHDDFNINELLTLYPENVDLLRRCRNSVYHFQKEIMDRRFMKIISNENETLPWLTALHYEFQKYLLNYPYRFSGAQEEQEGLAEKMAECIGWWPLNTHSAIIRRVKNECVKLASFVVANPDESLELASSTLKEISSIHQKMATLDSEPFLFPALSNISLSRWKSSNA